MKVCWSLDLSDQLAHRYSIILHDLVPLSCGEVSWKTDGNISSSWSHAQHGVMLKMIKQTELVGQFM